MKDNKIPEYAEIKDETVSFVGEAIVTNVCNDLGTIYYKTYTSDLHKREILEQNDPEVCC